MVKEKLLRVMMKKKLPGSSDNFENELAPTAF